MQTDIQYYHRIVGVVLVSTDFPIPLGLRFQKNGEGEVSCALALLQDLVGQLGRRFLDVLVGDALYLQAPFVKEVERLGLVWAFTLRSEEHTSELQSRVDLVCRLLLEKKKKNKKSNATIISDVCHR